MSSRVRRGSYVFYETERPDNSVLADGTWFRGKHEIAFGGSWRKVRDDERQEFPGSGADNLHAADYATSRGIQAWLWRPFFASSELLSAEPLRGRHHSHRTPHDAAVAALRPDVGLDARERAGRHSRLPRPAARRSSRRPRTA